MDIQKFRTLTEKEKIIAVFVSLDNDCEYCFDEFTGEGWVLNAELLKTTEIKPYTLKCMEMIRNSFINEELEEALNSGDFDLAIEICKL